LPEQCATPAGVDTQTGHLRTLFPNNSADTAENKPGPDWAWIGHAPTNLKDSKLKKNETRDLVGMYSVRPGNRKDQFS